MLHNLIITGVGGQGNVLASQVLGRAAVASGLKVTIGETFGLSQRGGSVMSHVRISDSRNYGPLIPPNMADTIVGLEPLETIRILPEFGRMGCVYIVNSRPIYPLNAIAGDMKYPDLKEIRMVLEKSGRRLFWLDATRHAVELGGPIMLNMIMLGALCGLPGFPVSADMIRSILPGFFPKQKLEVNYRALEAGGRLISENEN
jgi:indolepyruvate ferredoxin oxidoreductase beta subunit